MPVVATEIWPAIAQSVIQDDFDLTIVNKMDVDHGPTVPLSPDVRAARPPRALPGDPLCRQRGAVPGALGPALLPPRRGDPPRGGSYDEPLNVQIWGTGGMSHQLQGRAGLINAEWDNRFLDRLIADPAELAQMPHIEYVREAGSRASSW